MTGATCCISWPPRSGGRGNSGFSINPSSQFSLISYWTIFRLLKNPCELRMTKNDRKPPIFACVRVFQAILKSYYVNEINNILNK